MTSKSNKISNATPDSHLNKSKHANYLITYITFLTTSTHIIAIQSKIREKKVNVHIKRAFTRHTKT